MMSRELKVGELAARSGLTVRTLHYYHEIGLLPPGRCTAAGHRLYGPDQIERLHRIRSLQLLGLSLEEIQLSLDDPRFALGQVLAMHADRLRDQIRRQRTLLQTLETITDSLGDGAEVPMDLLLDSLEEVGTMEKFEKYYTPEQLDQLREREKAMGPEAIEQGQNEWAELIAAVRTAMEEGQDPGSPGVQALAARWGELVRAFTGGDAGITRSLGTMHKAEPEMGASFGLDPAIFAYIAKASGAGGAQP